MFDWLIYSLPFKFVVWLVGIFSAFKVRCLIGWYNFYILSSLFDWLVIFFNYRAILRFWSSYMYLLKYHILLYTLLIIRFLLIFYPFFLSIYLFIYLLFLSVELFTASVYLSIYLSICLSVCVSVYPFIHSFCLSNFLSPLFIFKRGIRPAVCLWNKLYQSWNSLVDVPFNIHIILPP